MESGSRHTAISRNPIENDGIANDSAIAACARAALIPRSLDDLPERVLARDLPAVELQQVHAAHLELRPGARRAGEGPLRDAESLAGPVPILAVAHVRDSLEAFREPGPHLGLAGEPVATGRRAARH